MKKLSLLLLLSVFVFCSCGDDDDDAKHNSNYVEVLEKYLEYNGSIQAVAEAMYTHRNTIIYRVTNIKKLLGTELDTTEERFQYQMAYYIRKM